MICDGITGDAVFVLPGVGFEPALDIDLRSGCGVLLHDLGQAAEKRDAVHSVSSIRWSRSFLNERVVASEIEATFFWFWVMRISGAEPRFPMSWTLFNDAAIVYTSMKFLSAKATIR